MRDLFGTEIAETEQEVIKSKKLSPFDYIDFMYKKVMPDDFSAYNPFLVNLSFSQHETTLFLAQEMNEHNVPKKAHYLFYYYIVGRKKQRGQWAKKTPQKNSAAIKSYFNVSERCVKDYARVLTDEQLAHIESWYLKCEGGNSVKNK